MHYNKFYFLHIPKTGGRFLTKYIFRPIKDILKENNIELIETSEDVMQHSGWPSWIDDQTYIFTVFRDPSEFFVSAVCHSEASKNNLIDETRWHILKDKGESLKVTKIDMYNSLSDWKYMENFQSKNFILQPTKKSIIQEAMQEYNKHSSIDKKLVFDRIKRTNLLIRHKDLKSMDYKLLLNKLSQDLNINIDIDISNIDREHFKNKASELLFNSLNQEDKNLINKHFSLDKEIYEDDSLFWSINH